MEIVNGSDLDICNGNLNNIKVWDFDTESTLAGSFVNTFAGDELNVDLSGWNRNEITLFSGDITGFDCFSKVMPGSETAAWDTAVSVYVSDSYQLTFDTENNSVKFAALA